MATRMVARLGAMLLLCALPGLMAQSWAASPSAASPEQQLTESVQQWVVSQLGGVPEQVRVLPMDARECRLAPVPC